MITCEVCDKFVDTDIEDTVDNVCMDCITDDQEEHGGDYPDRL